MSRLAGRTATKLPAQPNRSLLDGLELLTTLAAGREPLGSRELARRLGWNVMRVNRLLKTLAYSGVARQTPDRRYTAGPAMHVLSVQSLAASGLLRRALEATGQLPTKRHSVALGVLWRDHVSYLFHARPGQPAGTALGAHELFPATRSSIGMVLLAHQPEAQVRALFRADPPPEYPNLAALLAELRQIREQAYAYVVQQARPRQASLAVPIGAEPYAGLALAQVTPAQVRSLLPRLRAAAERIEPASGRPESVRRVPEAAARGQGCNNSGRRIGRPAKAT